MNPTMEMTGVVNNEEKRRFEAALGDEVAYIDYRHYKNDIAFMHTYVPDNFRGKGVASAMAVSALDFARREKKKILLYCPFMSKYVKDHPEYYDLVDMAYHQSFFNNSAPKKD